MDMYKIFRRVFDCDCTVGPEIVNMMKLQLRKSKSNLYTRESSSWFIVLDATFTETHA